MGVSKHVFESTFLVQCAAKSPHFIPTVKVFKRTLNDHFQFVKVEGSCDVIARPGLHRFDSTFHRAKRHDKNYDRIGVFVSKFLEQVDPGNARHPHVSNDEVRRLTLHDLQCLPCILRLLEFIFRGGQSFANELTVPRDIVND